MLIASFARPANAGTDPVSFASNVYQGNVSAGWTLAGTGDFDGDGDADLLWFNATIRTATVWSSTGTNFTPNTFQTTVATGWSIAGLGDFGGDGKTDLVWKNGNNFAIWTSNWSSNGAGFQQNTYVDSVASGWTLAGIGDFDGDRKADLAWFNSGTNTQQYQDGKPHSLFAYALDTNPQVGGSQLDLLSASPKTFLCTGGVTPIGNLYARGATKVYSGEYLTAIEFPVGPVGSGGILHFGDATRNESWIVNGLKPDTFQPRNQGNIPNSFFAVRVQPSTGSAVVRALQTTPVGKFTPMQSLTFTGEYPIATYQFSDPALPIAVTETVLSPMIPGNLKDSAIPTAIYQFKFTNTGTTNSQVWLLATQQNAVGYDGQSLIQGSNQDSFSGYGANVNTVTSASGSTKIAMTQGALTSGSMELNMLTSSTTATASWTDLGGLYNDFAVYDKVSNPTVLTATSAPGATVDAAIASGATTLAPGQSVTIPVVLSWHFPKNSNYFSTAGAANTGMHYKAVWTDASAVDQYVVGNLASLLTNTQLYHDTLYDSTLPQYLLDRISSSLAVLHTPVVFWSENGFFGAWEGLGCCANMPNHVWHYAQAPARLWPDVGRMWDNQWFSDIDPLDGFVPSRINLGRVISNDSFDGQAGNVLMAYRDYLNTGDTQWLRDNWDKHIKLAIDYLIKNFDPGCTGELGGAAFTTLDRYLPAENPWLGSLYLAAVNATSHMAAAISSTGKPPCSNTNVTYGSIYSSGQTKQETAFWRPPTPYYVEFVARPGAPQNVLGNASEIDMLLGQWWSSQLGLGDIYDSTHMTTALANLYAYNHKESNYGFSSTYAFRDFVEDTDASMQMATWPNGDRPSNASWYYDETMTGFEYAAAATMIQRGLLDQGLRIVLDVRNRYDGRLRADKYLSARWDESLPFGFNPIDSSCIGICDGTGNPFGDDEAGKWYGRSMSSWSLLLAAQGFSDDLSDSVQSITFAPKLSPDNHRSFFTASNSWGTLQQTRTSSKQTDQIMPKFGSLTLQTVNLVIPSGKRVTSAIVVANGVPIASQGTNSNGNVKVSIPRTIVPAGSSLTITMNLG